MSLIKPSFSLDTNAPYNVSVSNRNAFSLFQELSWDTSADHRSCGRLFQMMEQLSEKLWSP